MMIQYIEVRGFDSSKICGATQYLDSVKSSANDLSLPKFEIEITVDFRNFIVFFWAETLAH